MVRTLVCDDAPQFKLLTEELALCWVHSRRHYKKLNPLVTYHQKRLDQFLTEFWDYYRELLAYREAPSLIAAEKLRGKFYQLFESDTGYQQLDEPKRLTAAKIPKLLKGQKHGTFLCLWWLRLANWASVFSNLCVTVFLSWEIFLLWEL